MKIASNKKIISIISCVFCSVIIIFLSVFIPLFFEMSASSNKTLVFIILVIIFFVILIGSFVVIALIAERRGFDEKIQRSTLQSQPIFTEKEAKDTVEFLPYIKVKLIKITDLENILRCMICKLEIRNKQLAYQCPICLSYFHKEHLEEWLESNPECPVCEQILMI